MNDKINFSNKKGILLFVVIFLIIIAIITYLFLPVKTKTIFTSAIDKISSINYDKQKEVGASVTIDTDIHNKENEDILNIINNIDLKYDVLLNSDAKKAYVKIDTKYEDKDLLSLSMNFKDDKAYLYSKELYSKNIIVPINDLEKIYQVIDNQKDYEVIVKETSKALEKSLKDSYFSKENAKVTLNGKEIKVVKNILKLNEDNLKEISKVLGEELDNDKFIESFSKVFDISKEEIKKELESMKKADITLEEDILISIYTKGKKYVGLEVSAEDGKLVVLKNTATNYSYEFNIEENNYKGTIEIKGKDTDIDLKITCDNENLNGYISVKANTIKDINIPEIDEENSIELDKLNNKEALKLYENIENNDGIKSLMEAIEKLG